MKFLNLKQLIVDDASCARQIRDLWVSQERIIEVESPSDDWAANGCISQVTYISGLECISITSNLSITEVLRELQANWINLKHAISGSVGVSDLWVQASRIIEIESTNERHSSTGMSLVTYEYGWKTKTITSQVACSELLRTLGSDNLV